LVRAFSQTPSELRQLHVQRRFTAVEWIELLTVMSGRAAAFASLRLLNLSEMVDPFSSAAAAAATIAAAGPSPASKSVLPPIVNTKRAAPTPVGFATSAGPSAEDRALCDAVLPHVAAFVAECTTLESLDLSQCYISPASAAALGAALRAHPSMRTLRLDRCGLGDDGLAAFAEALGGQVPPHLATLSLRYNAASASMTAAFVAAVVDVATAGPMKQLALWGSPVTSASRGLIAAAALREPIRPAAPPEDENKRPPSASPSPNLDTMIEAEPEPEQPKVLPNILYLRDALSSSMS
jgi:hypothetical protein